MPQAKLFIPWNFFFAANWHLPSAGVYPISISEIDTFLAEQRPQIPCRYCDHDFFFTPQSLADFRKPGRALSSSPVEELEKSLQALEHIHSGAKNAQQLPALARRLTTLGISSAQKLHVAGTSKKQGPGRATMDILSQVQSNPTDATQALIDAIGSSSQAPTPSSAVLQEVISELKSKLAQLSSQLNETIAANPAVAIWIRLIELCKLCKRTRQVKLFAVQHPVVTLGQPADLFVQLSAELSPELEEDLSQNRVLCVSAAQSPDGFFQLIQLLLRALLEDEPALLDMQSSGAKDAGGELLHQLFILRMVSSLHHHWQGTSQHLPEVVAAALQPAVKLSHQFEVGVSQEHIAIRSNVPIGTQPLQLYLPVE